MSNQYKKGKQGTSSSTCNLGLVISYQYLDPICLEVFVACRLLPLDKNPGMHPIGAGEVTR